MTASESKNALIVGSSFWYFVVVYGNWRKLSRDNIPKNEYVWWSDVKTVFRACEHSAWFDNNIRWKLENGIKINFYDKWNGQITYAKKYSRVYNNTEL